MNIFNQYKNTVISILVVFLFGIVIFLNLSLKSEQIKVAQLESKLALLEPAIETCNRTTDTLAANNKIIAENLKVAQANVADIRNRSNATIRSILAETVPKDCEGATSDLATKLNNMRIRWIK